MSSDFTFGIEEEFFVGRRRTRNVATRLPKKLIKQGERALGERLTHEMLRCQLELVSPVLDSFGAACQHVFESRRTLARIAASQGLSLIASGTHPLAAWVDQEITDNPRCNELAQGFQIVGRRNLFCGLHVHVGIPPGIDRVQLMNRAMRWLPLFLALSTSSPFWNRNQTGLLSYRQTAYDEWPRSGIPDFFADEAQYGQFTERLVQGGAMQDASFLWWAIRPSLRYPTLELRITDACTDARDTIAIAGLYRALIAFLVRHPEHGKDWTSITRRVIDENRWRAKRYGTSAQFIDDRTGEAVPVPKLFQQLCELVQEDAERLGCTPAFKQLSATLRNGTSAHRQLEIYIAKRQAGLGRRPALHAVVDWLAEQSVPPMENDELAHESESDLTA